MKKIFPLPEEVIAKIAAGEVIERPVYAVKELVENALDAQADAITVHIVESGLKRITVIDNGTGMIPEDLQESFKPHTTSKLSSEEELSHIQTLGFRGEALASIAAISNMTIQSRTGESTTGTKIEIREGQIEKVTPVGMPQGTVVTVEHLFYPVPGRKKFLKSARTEFRHIVDVMTRFSLSYPSVHFTLVHNGRQIFDLPASDQRISQTSSLDRMKQLLGSTIYANLLPVSYQDSYIKIIGFLTKPQVASATTQKQFLFINNRSVHNKLISLAVKEAYGTLLEQQAYPICVLFLSLPYEVVDINVHPRKEEVRFSDNQLIYDAVHRAIAQTLLEHNLTFHADSWKGIGISDAPRGVTGSYAGRLLREKKLPWTIHPMVEISGSDVIQVQKLYLITPARSGIVLTDQHAAHERILYEQLLEEFKKQKKEQALYTLSTEQFLDLALADAEIVEEYLPLFTKLGFLIERFQKQTYLLRAVPMLFQDRDRTKLLQEMIDALRQEQGVHEVDQVSKKIIAYLACRAAIKAGDRVTKKQAKDLLELLKKTPNNTTCPHGRPVQVVLPIEKINTLFKRR